MSGLLNILTESVNEVPRIEFPNLFDKSIIVNRVAFNLFGIDIYWYGVIIAVGVILTLCTSASSSGLSPTTFST